MTANRPKFRNSPFAALLLHLLLPGLGHMYWREYLFGIFIFLVMLMAAALTVLSFFIALPIYAQLIVWGLPLTFYLISFGDLFRTVRSRQIKHPQSPRKARIYGAIAIAYQLLWPLAPVNFAWQNAPEIFVLDSNNLAPLFRNGDLMKASRLSYMLNTYFVDKPIFHSLPDRFDIVRFRFDSTELAGVVIGLPGEDIEIIGGVVTVNGAPQLQPSAVSRLINGDWPPTTAGGYSLLIAYPEFGQVRDVYEIPITDLIGKLERLL